MKIYNKEKTKELIDPDLEKGYVYQDKRLVKHHEAIPEKVIKTVQEQVEEYEAEGKEITTGIGKNGETSYYLTLAFIPKTEKMGADGREVKRIEPITEPAKEAWDEYEDILVYHPFTEDEYVDYLRSQREDICFSVINRGAAWYARLTPEQNEELQNWYQEWLDVTETKVKPKTPDWI